jgi:acyl dehydratase
MALCHKILVTELLGPDSGSLGSPGVDEIRWLKPVRPGDTLSVRTEVVEVTPSRSKPGGLVKLRARGQPTRVGFVPSGYAPLPIRWLALPGCPDALPSWEPL